MKFIISIFIFLMSFSLAAQSIMSIADQYFEAYQALDFKKMSKLYADDVVFTDPTFSAINPAGFHLKGKDNVIKTLTEGFHGTLKWKLEFNSKFKTGQYVIVSGTIHSETKGAVWGKPEKEKLRFDHSFTTILKFHKGIIVEHRDYIDYEDASKQLRKQ